MSANKMPEFNKLKQLADEILANEGNVKAAAITLKIPQSTAVRWKNYILEGFPHLLQKNITNSMGIIDEHLSLFCSNDFERKVCGDYLKLSDCIKVAELNNVSPENVFKTLRAIKLRAAQQGFAPEAGMTKTAPEPFVVSGVSTLYDKDGKISAQWVKTKADDAKVEIAKKAAMEALCETIPRAKPIKLEAKCIDDLATQYTITDYHFGMLAWGQESGDNWDIKIAERLLISSFSHLVGSSPAAKTGIIAQLGDFLHSDGIMPVTPTHGHILDQDGRFAKVVGSAVKALRAIVDIALTKHERVIVLMAEGNHDISSSIWLRAMFSALYENEPRVEVITSALPYYMIEHGSTMIGMHHGHLKKNNELPLLFASQFAEAWGRTKFRYIHTGHRHHVDEKEHSGVTVIQHSTLAARDAYAARGGWISDRQAQSITYSKKYGIVSRNVIRPEMCE